MTPGQGMGKPIVAIALAVLAGNAGVQAQTYPSHSSTIVVPCLPAGSTDTVDSSILSASTMPLAGSQHSRTT